MTHEEHLQRLAELIADKLATGLFHPGSGDQAPMTIGLPMFRTVGMAPEVRRQVQLSVNLMAEAILYLIETEGQSDITPRKDSA
jgi:hypothetical protein